MAGRKHLQLFHLYKKLPALNKFRKKINLCSCETLHNRLKILRSKSSYYLNDSVSL